MVRYRAASAMAPIPFDRHGVPGTIELVDDFVMYGADVTASSASAAVASDLDWSMIAVAGDSGHTAIVVGESDHQGIMALWCDPSDTAAVALKLGRAINTEADEAFFLDTNGLYVATVLRVPTLAATKVAFGLTGVAAIALPNSSALDVIHWVFDNADTAAKWIAQVNGAGTDVEQASAITYVASDWVLLEIAADTSSVTFRITTEDDTETIVLDGADSSVEPVVAMRPEFIVCAETDGTNAVIDIDLFVLRYLRRQSLTASWLGQ